MALAGHNLSTAPEHTPGGDLKMSKCTGSGLRNLTTVEVDCAKCGTTVELFSDERRRKCPGCGEQVNRDAVAPTCAAWCPSAASCIGHDRFKELVDSGQLVLTPKRESQAS